MLILNAKDVRDALPMVSAIEAMRVAFIALEEGRACMPSRAHLDVKAHEGTTLVMPAYARDASGDALTVKVVSVFPRNPGRSLPLIHATVLVVDEETGRPMALLEGGTLTALRTGAVSGVATDLLARPESRRAAILGCGVQARTQLEAVATVRNLDSVVVYSPEKDEAAKFAAEVSGKSPVPEDVSIAADPADAVVGADIICTATTSATPVFNDVDIRPGTHINAIGSFQPHVQELPEETVARAAVFVDDYEAALAETGDLIQPLQKGLFGREHILADLGELLVSAKPGRTRPEQVTLFKSVGLAVQDAFAARKALKRAEEAGLGQRVEL